MAKHPPAKMSAVLGRCRRTGRWRLGARSNVLAVLGSVRLDMRHSFVEGDEPDQLKMKVMVLFGSAVLILPEGAEVRPSGMSFLSAEWVDVPDHPVPSGLPTLDVEWTCVLGRVHVVTGSVLEKVAAEKAAQEAAEIDLGGPDPAPAVQAAPVAAGPEPEPEIMVDMGMVDSEPWSMSDHDLSEPTPEPEPVREPEIQPEPEPAPEAEVRPEPEPEPAPEPEADAAEAAPQLVEAWRTHDWGPGIIERDGEDEEGDAAPAAAPAGPEAEPAGSAEPEAEAADATPQLVEAWRTHDWGPGIIERDGEDEEDDASATAGASA